jgi:dihydroorotase
MSADLLLYGGEVLDPERGIRERADITIEDGRIKSVGPDLRGRGASTELDVCGLLVTPGLVDLHSHVFAGQDLGIDPNLIGPQSGTTTFVDAGSAGGHLFEAFRIGTISTATPRILAFLNIASIGTTSTELAGELEHAPYASEDVCVACAERHPDTIVGVKVRASGDVVGHNGLEPVRRARRAAERLRTRVMVHISPPPPELDAILFHMRDRDILTHCFTGQANRLAHDAIRPSVLDARERGVLFDVGHGAGSFDVRAATAMLSAGFLPDTISSDIHAYASFSECNLPTVLSKFVALGLSLEEAIARATFAPARILGLDATGIGTVRLGAPGDLAVFHVIDQPVVFNDTAGHSFTGNQRLDLRLTIQHGMVVHDRLEVVRRRSP